LVLAWLAVVPACATDTETEDDSDFTQAERLRASEYTSCKRYKRLSETGLFAKDDAGKMTDKTAPGVRAFEPAYPLWTDGADKRRWIKLPSNARIDTSDMDHWKLPKGTKLWKEFVYDGKRKETRLIEIGCDADPAHPEWGQGALFMGTFLWDEGNTDATFAPQGQYPQVPTQEACARCHGGEPGSVLGFSALQLSGKDLPLNITKLKAESLLSRAPDKDFTLPWNETTNRAAGYLHGNCGHCHSEGGRAFAVVHQQLRLSASDVSKDTFAATQVYASIVDQPTQTAREEGWFRIKAGQPDKSYILFRMRDEGRRMPPGTLLVDDKGVAAVQAWIKSLAPGATTSER
jgi:hypothetical protein